MEINGAALQDLMYITDSNYDVISDAMSMKGVGALVGGLGLYWMSSKTCQRIVSFQLFFNRQADN